jgi:hypothetical protein
MVVGNKLDLEAEDRAVSFDELVTFCEQNGDMGYIETSAKENQGVEIAFMKLASQALTR